MANPFKIVAGAGIALLRTVGHPEDEIEIRSLAPGRNLVVNGGCEIDQVNGGALITPVYGDYPIDNFIYGTSQASKLQTQQISAFSSLNGNKALRTSVLSSYTPLSTDYFLHTFKIEGLNSAFLQWGTVYAKPVSLSFRAMSSVSGIFSGSIRNHNGTKSYCFSFTLVANTSTVIKIENIPGCTDGDWLITNTASIFLSFDLGSGSDNKSTANSWLSGNYRGATGSTSLVSQANGSYLDIGDVQLEAGPVCTEFERKPYDQVLRECQRYFQKDLHLKPIFNACNATTNGLLSGNLDLIVPMRTAPTIAYTGTLTIQPGGASVSSLETTPSTVNVAVRGVAGSGLTAGYCYKIIGLTSLTASARL